MAGLVGAHAWWTRSITWLGWRSCLVDACLLGAGVTLVGTLTGLEMNATDIDGGRYLQSGLSG